ncbi:transporter substrate-binding domain-containing protein [Paucibacter sp. O1-1]|nr:transporter substrate-binding domain-containing protein [Paucibacter sp. O1-1]MDA3826829.1 transporter substrate-binding domain-containing protein [Paucibacter sp. O1-1]
MERRQFLSSALLLAGPAKAAAPGKAADSRAIFVGNTAPYSHRGADGAPAGVAYEMVSEIARDLPFTLDPVVAPLVRAFRELASQGPALIIPPARLPSREHLLRWVVPLIPVRLMLFARSDSGHDIASIESARALEIGILNAPGLEETYRSAGFQRIKHLASNEVAIRMLMHERLPAVLTADCSVYAALKEAGIARSQIREGAVLADVTLWLAASRNYPEAELRLWQAAAEKRRPELAKILARHV